MTEATYPRFDDLRPASRTTARVKASNRKTGTKCETILGRELWRRGYRYRKNVKSLRGTPDLVFRRDRLVVFCDGDFWHGRNWEERRRKLEQGHNADYWVSKIERNRARGAEVTRGLEEAGWHVIRLWETDILANPEAAADLVATTIDQLRSDRAD